MAVGGPIDLDRAVESWRRTLGEDVRLRRDDVDELCDHFRESVRMQMQAGASFEVAVATGRCQFGSVDEAINEMGRVHRPPSFFRRWCVLLVAFTVLQSIWVMLRISSAMMRVVRFTDMPVDVPGSVVMTVAAVLVGGGLIVGITTRFGLLRGGSVMGRAGNGFVPFVYVGGLCLVLLVAVVLIEYWEWWLAVAQHSGVPQPWGGITTALVPFVVAPVLTLTTATLFARWHPALESLDGC